MSAMTTISSVMALGYLNVMFCMMVYQLADNMGQMIDQWVSKDMSNHKTLNNFLNKDGV